MITYKKGDLLADEASALVNTVNMGGVMGKGVYFGETDHPIPWQTDHLNCWRKDAANAVEAFTKIVI